MAALETMLGCGASLEGHRSNVRSSEKMGLELDRSVYEGDRYIVNCHVGDDELGEKLREVGNA